ncbi:MAG: bi-domain-containing oxidoreductase, partial [Spirosoma sp.]|nr:bi-domain-containing oxidoreductase [Spirosoma sp.]
GPGQVLIRSRRSLVSPGTERMLVAFGRGSLFSKAQQQPERVRQVFDKIKTDGLGPTINAIRRRLDQPMPLGYCNTGEVMAVGANVTDVCIGQRVASNGPHAEVVCVPRKLVAPIPDGVSDDEAAFTVAGAIALQSVRLIGPTLGETVVVIGLGLIGLLTVSLLELHGCCVIGIDSDETRCILARKRGITALNPAEIDVVRAVLERTGHGADGVVVAAASESGEIIAQAARMSRQRGRAVVSGVVPMNLNRADFFAKELTLQVSHSYGPGRHDVQYEQHGHDYPVGYVRWTENGNFQEILRLLSDKKLPVNDLITDVVPLTEFADVYAPKSQQRAIATLFSYPDTVDLNPVVQLRESRFSGNLGGVGMIGAGNFADATLLPALLNAGLTPLMIASVGGLNATRLARKFGIAQSTSDYRQILDNPAIDLCVIATRHDSHAHLTIAALQAGKHVFVEKPLALYDHELSEIITAQQQSGRAVTVGFNRRFSPFVQKMKALLGSSASQEVPINVVATMNAGNVPPNSWLHDRAVGGGRLIAEAVHLVDLITFLTGSRVTHVCLNAMGTNPTDTTDSATLLLHYENGATGTVHYFANGSTAYPKERVEAYSQGRTLVLDNYRKLTGYGFKNFSSLRGRQDKGHRALLTRIAALLRDGGPPPIPFADSVNATQTMLAALQSRRGQCWVEVTVTPERI